jgi:multidrug transporter EmrE-like cation transporter
MALLIGCLWVGEPLRAMDVVAMGTILAGVYAIQATSSNRRHHRHDQ